MKGVIASPSGELVLEDVSISIKGQPRGLIERLTLSAAPGEVVTLTGPSGSGKSTVLSYVAGFLDRDAFVATGRVAIGGEPIGDLPAEDRRVGILFQDSLLFPHLSVAGNLLFGVPRGLWRDRHKRRARVLEALADAGLAGFAERDPATLSGGQKARVAVLRTLLSEPRVLLLDEPFGALDAALREDFRSFVFAHVRERRLPTLLVTHDPEDAESAGGAMYDLNRYKY